jgi:protein-tyrosine phosphatase
MVDIHCHILPEVDDGPKSWTVATAMCDIALADGIDHIVATPHANDRYAYDREYLEAALQKLRNLIQNTTLQLTLGCDFHFSYENVQDLAVHPKRYVIGTTGYLLVEFSNYAIAPNMTDSLYRLLDGGIAPIITHPERCPVLLRNEARVLEWVNAGCAVQVTASALTGRWGEPARAFARSLLDKDAVHVLATDAHDTEHRPPKLSSAREIVADRYGNDIAEALVEYNPRAIVAGQRLPYFPSPVVKD